MEQDRQLKVYRGCSPVVDVEYDSEGNVSLTWTIADALAKAEGVEATELPPLYDAIDLDLVEQLLRDADPEADADFLLSFQFDNWNVFVCATGRIRVCDAGEVVEPEPIFESSVR